MYISTEQPSGGGIRPHRLGNAGPPGDRPRRPMLVCRRVVDSYEMPKDAAAAAADDIFPSSAECLYALLARAAAFDTKHRRKLDETIFTYKQLDSLYTVSKKNCTPKAGRHKFIKISSPIMIFHTRHRYSVADQLSSKSLVRVEYQLEGFHGNQAPHAVHYGAHSVATSPYLLPINDVIVMSS